MANKVRFSADELLWLRCLAERYKQPAEERVRHLPPELTHKALEQSCEKFANSRVLGAGWSAVVYLCETPIASLLAYSKRELAAEQQDGSSNSISFSSNSLATSTAATDDAAIAIKLHKPDVNPDKIMTPSTCAIKEIALLSLCQHESLQRIVGFCLQPKVSLLYPLMRGGSVNDRIISSKRGRASHNHHLDERQTASVEQRMALLGVSLPTPPLLWHQRLRIVRDVAEALDYLHTPIRSSGGVTVKPSVLHMDLTADNVLLDANLNGVLCDLGNARVIEDDKGRDQTSAALRLTPYLCRSGMVDVAERLPHLLVPRASPGEMVCDSNALGFILMQLATYWVGPANPGSFTEWRGEKVASLSCYEAARDVAVPRRRAMPRRRGGAPRLGRAALRAKEGARRGRRGRQVPLRDGLQDALRLLLPVDAGGATEGERGRGGRARQGVRREAV